MYDKKQMLSWFFLGAVVVAGAARQVQSQCYPDRLVTSDGVSLGGTASISGMATLFGAAWNNDLGTNAGAAYVFEFTGSDWAESAILHAPDGATEDRFGCSVGLSGDFAVIGAYQDDDLGDSSGSAYVFQRRRCEWVFVQKLTASDGGSPDHFGHSVAISGDRIVVGAPRHGHPTGEYAAFLFERVGGSWTETAELIGQDVTDDSEFGCSVSIHGDRALIGSWAGLSGDNASGHVFERVGTSWVWTAKLEPAGLALEGYPSVAIWGDVAVIGAPDDTWASVGPGDACVFEHDGSSWVQKLFPAPPDLAPNDRFGDSVAVSGSFVLVGAPGDDDHGSGSGSAYLFERKWYGWEQVEKFHAGAGSAGYHFGGSVSISDDYLSVITGGGAAFVLPWSWKASTYCLALPNSVGPGANICWLGRTSLSADSFHHLVASECPPDQFLMFYYGASTDAIPFGNGVRCVNGGGVGIFRFKPTQTDAAGNAIMKVDYTEPPAGGGGSGAWLPGDTWYCQGWYRDPAGGGAEFNLTNGLEVVIRP